MTVLVSEGTGRTRCASHEIPRNIPPRHVPITISVDRAFFHSGGRNAGTPFEMASTPVIAAPPEANACRIRKRPACFLVAGIASPVEIPRWPVAAFTIPMTIIDAMEIRNKYVGAAKIFPDSLTPRRLPHVMMAMNPTAMGTRYG